MANSGNCRWFNRVRIEMGSRKQSREISWTTINRYGNLNFIQMAIDIL